jgi:hypothetical protein
MAFPSRDAYERFVYSLPGIHSEVQSSTLHLYTNSPTTCFVRGSIWFRNGLELCVFEYLDFADGELLDYRYVLLRGEEPVRWYDSQPHPEIPELVSTFPHHLHEPPDIKHNRKPAPGISFTAPNLPTLIADCIALGESPAAGPPRTLRERDARYVVDTQSQAIAVLLTLEEYEHYLDLLDDEADSQDSELAARLTQAAAQPTGGE